MGGDGLGGEAELALAGALASGSLVSLRVLNLKSNSIGDAGLTAFSEAVASGSLPMLGALDLRDNKIGDVGMVELLNVNSKAMFSCLNV